ncbi:MAG: serine hydrolase [Gemmatimonadales bacterium]|nr:serine hydrolase [Gemmatimonadales bacterium]
MRPALTLTLLLLAAAPLTAQSGWPAVRRDKALEAKLQALAAEVQGDVGIYVRHLKTGQGAMLRADELFPTASMIKVPILVTVFDRIERGTLRFDTTLVWADSLRYGGEDDLFDKLQAGAKIPLAQATLMMITTSDNAASLWLQGIVTGRAINQWLAANGFDSTRVNSRTPGREANRTAMGWGQTTPREMAELVARIRAGTVVSAAASAEMYRHLTRIYYTAEALSALPPWVQAASKQGAVDRSRSEVVLVNGPSGDYVFAVITKNQQDQSYGRNNQGYVLLRNVSALLWRHFEPKHPWAPSKGVDRFQPK